MAHELAHNMGVDHDGVGVNKDCDGALRVLDFSDNVDKLFVKELQTISVSTSKLLYCKKFSPCHDFLEFKISVIRREVHHGSQTKPWCHEVVAMH